MSASSNGSKTLIIAEKPSVANDLARVLGRVPKKNDWFENDELIISSAVGHLVELLMPEDINKDLKRWNLDNLPIIPESFKLKPIADNKKKFEELKKLIRRKDVGAVVNACDAGREGELIFTYITELAGNDKPVRRMWMSSMTPQAIKEAFANPRSDEQMRPLQDAARSRSEADWLIGINGSRACTLQYGSLRNSATVGRVQTPTLALVCDREEEIRNFVPRAYWKLEATFTIASGTYTGTYQKPAWKKNDDEHDRIDRLWQLPEASQLFQSLTGTPYRPDIFPILKDTEGREETKPFPLAPPREASVTEEKKRSKQAAPRLYDLTSLQREANSRYGFPAGMTLNIAQALYEKHKMLTYPRTDSRALPEDYGQTVKSTLGNLHEPYAVHAERILQNSWVKPGNKRIFNNKQVSDHFAIIPTDAKPKKLNEREQKIYDMVTRRFLAVFYPPAEYDVTTRYSTVGEHRFKTEGKVLAEPGWLTVYGKSSAAGDADSLAPLTDTDGQPPMAKLSELAMPEDATRPPARYSEATLLAAMEGAGKFVDDEELAEAMKERGLGTPATRAATIDHLIKQRYLHREGRELIPSAKAEGLMAFLRKLGVEELRSPALTGDWEYKLRQVEEGKLSREAFMQGIIDMTRKTIKRLAEPPPAEPTNLTCPMDNQPLLENHKSWVSQSTVEVRGRHIPLVAINKIIGNRHITSEEVATLLDKKEVGPLDEFKSRTGKTFSAVLKLIQKDNGSWRVDFDFGDDENADADGNLDLSKYPIVGPSPVDETPVHAAPNAYLSEGLDKDGKPAFRLSRTMLNRTFKDEEVAEMLAKGKSPLLKGFKSKRTGRLFDAHLKLKDDGGIEFEFPPRKKSARKAAQKATQAGSAQT